MPRNILPRIAIRPRVYYYHPRYLYRLRALYGEPVATSEMQCSRHRSSTTRPIVPPSHVFVQSSTYRTIITPVSYPFPRDERLPQLFSYDSTSAFFGHHAHLSIGPDRRLTAVLGRCLHSLGTRCSIRKSGSLLYSSLVSFSLD